MNVSPIQFKIIFIGDFKLFRLFAGMEHLAPLIAAVTKDSLKLIVSRPTTPSPFV